MWFVEAVVAEQLTDMSPILLFHVGIIIFLVGAGAGKLDRGLRFVGKVSEQVIIQEFGAVVAIKAQDGEGKSSFNIFDLGKDTIRALVPDRAIFRPAAEDVSEGEAPNEVAGQRITTVSDGIGLKEARFGDIPVVGFNGDLVFEKCSGLGTA